LSDADDDWIVTTPTKPSSPLYNAPPRKSSRVWLEPTSSEEKLDEPNLLSLPIEGVRLVRSISTPSEQLSSTTSADIEHLVASLPAVHVDGGESNQGATNEPLPTAAGDEEPTAEDRDKAIKIFSGEEDFVSKTGAASWLGGSTAETIRARTAYMELFDWTGFNILLALRDLCGKLAMKAESQQLDRLIDAFSRRWCDCNPNHGFKADGKYPSILFQSKFTDRNSCRCCSQHLLCRVFAQYRPASCGQ